MTTRALITLPAVFLLFAQPMHDERSMHGVRGAPPDAKAPGMEHDIAMYGVEPLSGCDDHHCLRCPHRDRCGPLDRCGMEDCGHEHAVVLCHGCALFFLRSAAGMTSCLERGREAAATLNAVAMAGEGVGYRYEVRSGGSGAEIWRASAGDEPDRFVLRVAEGDVEGYRYRATVIPMSREPSAITGHLVARWWAALLQDHYDAMILGLPPTRTVQTHCGRPLRKAYDEARRIVPEGPIPMERWREVFTERLAPMDRDRLALAAQIIPENFEN